MTIEHWRAAIEAAAPRELDGVVRLMWQAVSNGEADFDAVADLAARANERRGPARLHCRPAAGVGDRLLRSIGLPSGGMRRLRSVSGSRPRFTASIERRRRNAASGWIPASLACRFTLGEQSVLSIVAQEAAKRGHCEMPIGAICSAAGIGFTTARNALREAQRLGLLVIQERRVMRNRNLPNVVRIISAKWNAWLASRVRPARQAVPQGGGFTFAMGNNTSIKPPPLKEAWVPAGTTPPELREAFVAGMHRTNLGHLSR